MRATIAGTGFNNPSAVGRTGCREGDPAILVREPDNPHDPNAVAVYITTTFMMMSRQVKIGHLKAPLAQRVAPKMDAGAVATARIVSVWNPPGREFPRVSIDIDLS